MSSTSGARAEYRLGARFELGSFDDEQRAALTALSQAQGALRISLADVEAASSLLLALLVELEREARRCDVALEFTEVPATVLAMVEFSGLDNLLPISPRS